jgi:hypothetical protein
MGLTALHTNFQGVNMKLRVIALAAFSLSIPAWSSAVALSDFAVTYRGQGSAKDVNNSGQVLLQEPGYKGFTVLDTVTGARSSVTLESANLAGASTKGIYAQSLNNTGFVSGTLDGGNQFVWSAGSGFHVVPYGYGNNRVNDAGVASGSLGTWSSTAGTQLWPTPRTGLVALNQANYSVVQTDYTYHNPPNPNDPGASGGGYGWVTLTVYNPDGTAVLSQSGDFTLVHGAQRYSVLPRLSALTESGLTVFNYANAVGYTNLPKIFSPTGAQLSADLRLQGVLANASGLYGSSPDTSLANPQYFIGLAGDGLPAVDISPLQAGQIVRINDAGMLLGTDGVNFTLIRPVPEPGTWAMMGLGLLGLGLVRHRATTATSRAIIVPARPPILAPMAIGR